MKISKKDMQLLVAALGILLAVCAYFFVYEKFNEKSTVLEQQNVQKQIELQKLQELSARKEEYEKQTTEMKSWINSFETRFPADILPENSIMMVKNMEESTRTTVDSLAFGAATELIANVEQQEQPMPVENQGAVSVESTVYPDSRMYELPLSISISATYSDFKELIKYIYAQNERMSVKGVSIGYNSENGELNGNMTMGTYYLMGTDKLYVEPQIPSMGMGVDTIFGNVD